jgi:hypothetical protein
MTASPASGTHANAPVAEIAIGPASTIRLSAFADIEPPLVEAHVPAEGLILRLTAEQSEAIGRAFLVAAVRARGEPPMTKQERLQQISVLERRLGSERPPTRETYDALRAAMRAYRIEFDLGAVVPPGAA